RTRRFLHEWVCAGRVGPCPASLRGPVAPRHPSVSSHPAGGGRPAAASLPALYPGREAHSLPLLRHRGPESRSLGDDRPEESATSHRKLAVLRRPPPSPAARLERPESRLDAL